MAAYASTDDIESRWRPLTDDERARAGTLLDDAAVRIDAECPPPPPPDVLSEQQLEARRIVSCEMVKRAMASPGGIGVTSQQQGAGPYQETTQFANPLGDLYLTKADRRLLGCGQQSAFTVRVERADGLGRHLPWCSLAFGGCCCSCGVDIAGRPIFEGAQP